MPSDRPIFVVGATRSGTTLLQLMLHAHPRIAIPPENRFVLPTYERRLRFGDLTDPAARRRLGEFIVRTKGHRFRGLGLDADATVAAIEAGPPTVGSALGIVLSGYAARFDSPRWGDKRPAYYASIPVLLRLFPDAQVVHLVRDPRDTVASMKSMPWSRQDIHHAVARWAQVMAYVDAVAAAHPGVVVELRYEQLCADPEGELRGLCAALEEDYDPAMAAPQDIAEQVVPDRRHWHANTRTAPTTAYSGRWRERLERWEVQLCETALKAPMVARGYEPSGAGRPPARELLRYTRVRAAREAAHRRRLVVDRLARRREPNPVAALLTAGQQAAAARK
jgi:hypothetical protein